MGPLPVRVQFGFRRRDGFLGGAPPAAILSLRTPVSAPETAVSMPSHRAKIRRLRSMWVSAAMLLSVPFPTLSVSAGAAVDTTSGAAGDAVERARNAQRGFERHRRRRLPPPSRPAADRCDEVVGRYCLFHGDDEDYRPPAEPASVRRRRDRLLELLADAARTAPGSGWVAGQRVRYLLEADRGAEAVEVARNCAARPWWCRALEGLALHRSGEPRAAERAFGEALAAMGDPRRRRWEDLSVLLEGDAADCWESADRPGRRALARRYWWLSDPLYLTPANERRVEHLARRVEDRILGDSAGPFGVHRGAGLSELLLRYGPHVGHERERRGPYDLTERPRVTGYHDPDALRFAPSPERMLSPLAPGGDGWRLADPRPHTTYAMSRADTVRELLHRITLFPRGDSVTVVVGFDAAQADADAFLYLGREGRPAARARAAGVSRGGLAARVPARPHLLSVEVLSRDGAWAERARVGLPVPRRPEGVPGLSGLLAAPATGASAPPSSLEAAVARLRGPGVVQAGTEMDLYWEVYGPVRLLSEMEVTVGLADGDGGWIRRLAGAVGLGDGSRVAGVEWRDRAVAGARIHPRALRLEVPADVEQGTYRLAVTVRLPGYDPLVASRPLRVEAGG